MRRTAERLLFLEARVPDIIYDVAEGGVTDGESFHFVFGNPTRNMGRFRAFFGKFRHRCITRQIDSRDAKLPNKAKVAGWSRIMARTATSFASPCLSSWRQPAIHRL